MVIFSLLLYNYVQMSIHTIADKIKGWAGERRQFLIFIALLVGASSLSFYLGYVARAEGHKEPLVAINCPANAYMDSLALSTPKAGTSKTSGISINPSAVAGASVIGSQNQATSGAYVASKNGKKYYPIDCAGAKRIKDENKVFFATPAAATAAGYSLGAGCK
jgi:hypothetical protein